MRSSMRGGAVIVSALVVANCGQAAPEGRNAAAGSAPAGGGVPGSIGAPADGTWQTQGADYAGTRYSPLHQVDASNAAQLQLAWSFSTGYTHGHEGAPLVANNTLYLVTPFPNVAYALDLTKHPATLKWKFEPHPDPLAIGKACCDVVNRGWALADGKLIYNLLDAHTVAVDAATGKEVWRTQLADPSQGITMTMAPLVVNGKVLVGNSGGEMGVHGWIAALDVASGKELWRAYSTGPDSLVKIGPKYRPFYSWLRGKDVGASSWPGDAWQHGAGAVWGWITYDPELNLIYHGTSNPGPWNQAQREGDNLFTSSVLARDPDTGELHWAYSFTPHDEWDYDGVNENILVDLPIRGQQRKVLVQFNRNGFAYTIDRATGEVLVAEPFGYENWAERIDLQTGRPVVVAEKTTHPNEWTYNVCPPDIGVKDQQPAAYSPRTHLFYVPTHHMCMDYPAARRQHGPPAGGRPASRWQAGRPVSAAGRRLGGDQLGCAWRVPGRAGRYRDAAGAGHRIARPARLRCAAQAAADPFVQRERRAHPAAGGMSIRPPTFWDISGYRPAIPADAVVIGSPRTPGSTHVALQMPMGSAELRGLRPRAAGASAWAHAAAMRHTEK